MTNDRRLVVVSNRVADDRLPAGGLVVALHDCLSAEGGLWIGTAPAPVDAPSTQLRDAGGDRYQRMHFEVTPEEHQAHYLEYSNATLWPLSHRRTELMTASAASFEGYMKVNKRLAQQMAEVLRPDDLIWIHDYHFLPLAAELRALGVANRIGFFLHIPFPTVSDLPALSQSGDYVDWLAAYDLIGLQTGRDVVQCLACLRDFAQSELLMDGKVRIGGRIVAVRSFPIGIDAAGFARDAANADALPDLHLTKGEKLLIGVDRLDYSKGLSNRFRAFGAYLDQRENPESKATFIQIAQPSRGDVVAYQQMRRELEQVAGDVNGRHGRLDWTPLRYLSQQVPRTTIAPLFRRADVGLVTPFADGMNLVAKEFVAAQDPEDPGVLILSHQAGASEQLNAGLLVNAFDPEDIADKIRTALAMPLDERIAIHAALLEPVVRQDIDWWTQSFVAQLSGPPEQAMSDIAVIRQLDRLRAAEGSLAVS